MRETSPRRKIGLAVVAAAALGAAAWACADPVHNTRVDALGDEAPNVSPGPTHRPGQPCLTCHGGGGPAEAELTVAGTIYQTAAPDSPPLVGATVAIFDGTQLADGGTPRSTVTNSAGNFFFRREEWSPVYPLHDIAVSAPGVDTPAMMHTTVGRDGSCATCHFEPRGPDSHGHIYLVLEPGDLPKGGLP
jgi:hypothetical protein